LMGNIDMSKHRLVNLGDPTAEHGAVNLKFLDRFLKHDGSLQTTGALNLGGYGIANVAEPVKHGI
jgi:hypothetical protein